MKEVYRTSQEHLEAFKKECMKWQDIFGLKGWEFYFEHKKDNENFAWFNINVVGRNVNFGLATEWNIKPTAYHIKKTAFHEVCELFLGRLKYLAESRCVRAEEIEEETHQVIRTLEHVLFDKW